MGIEGAAWATIIGQIVSLLSAMIFHYCINKEIKNKISALKPNISIIKGIYKIGISAALMQGLLAVMMLGMTSILGTIKVKETANLLQGSFGIYYKIMQFGLFAAFGLSNTIISILSFNYGLKNKKRVKSCIKYGIIDSVVVAIIITLLFEIFASPLSNLFAMASGEGSNDIQKTVINAIRIASLGYAFMAISVAIQGILQAFRYALLPFLISALRLCILVFPIAYLFTLSKDVVLIVWWTFPIAEFITAIISFFILNTILKNKKHEKKL